MTQQPELLVRQVLGVGDARSKDDKVKALQANMSKSKQLYPRANQLVPRRASQAGMHNMGHVVAPLSHKTQHHILVIHVDDDNVAGIAKVLEAKVRAPQDGLNVPLQLQ